MSKVVSFGSLDPVKFPPGRKKIQLFHKNGFLRANLGSGLCMHINVFVRYIQYGPRGSRNYEKKFVQVLLTLVSRLQKFNF